MRDALLNLTLEVVRIGVGCGSLLGLLVYLAVFVCFLLNGYLVWALLWGTIGAGLLAPFIDLLWLVFILVGFVFAALAGRSKEYVRRLNS